MSNFAARQATRNVPDERKYRFPAKRHGWGWGLPIAWQGWAVLGLFLLLIAAGGYLVLPRFGRVGFLVYGVVLCVALGAICWLKGERPRWRWGGRGF
jgi:hypothetical protein